MYSASIACNITDPSTMHEIDYSNPVLTKQTRVLSSPDGKKQFIADISNGSCIGYKYFKFQNIKEICVKLSGNFQGSVHISTDMENSYLAGSKQFICDSSIQLHIPVTIPDGTHALYFFFEGYGKCNMFEFELNDC